MPMAPGHLAAVALGLCGLGLMAYAFVGEGFSPARMLFGIALVMAALITAGLQLLNRNGASYAMEEDA